MTFSRKHLWTPPLQLLAGQHLKEIESGRVAEKTREAEEAREAKEARGTEGARETKKAKETEMIKMTNQTYTNGDFDNQAVEAIFQGLFRRYPVLEPIRESIWQSYQVMEACFASGGKLLIVGNGGSCSDAEHIVGELMKGFVKRRELPQALKAAVDLADPYSGGELSGKLQGALPAIALTGHASLSTAFLNDVDGELIYAQQLCGYGVSGDVLLGISTSGNARNIDCAVTVAKAKGMKVVGLTGKDGGALARRSDAAMVVPVAETYQIQELHLPIYHTLCLMLEERFF